MRSIPRPNANPEYFEESISQFSRTLGFTTPHQEFLTTYRQIKHQLQLKVL